MEYVNKVTLEVDGKEITDFKAFTDKESEVFKQVNLMSKTGFMATTERPGCLVDYVVPAAAPFNWRTVRDGRLTVEKEGGGRITFIGVHTLKVGEAKYDGDNEVVQTIELGATRRIEE